MAEDTQALLSSLMGMLGDHPEEKLSKALSSLGIGENTKEATAHENTSENTTEGTSNAAPNAEGLEALLGLQALLSSAGGDDDRARFLTALKPFLSKDRQSKIDNTIRLLRIAKMAEIAGKSDLLKDLKL